MPSVHGSSSGPTWDKEAVAGDHGASAKANLEAAGSDLKSAVTPDWTRKAIDQSNLATSGMERILARATLIPLGAIIDVAQIPVMLGAAIKDAADASIHGLLSLFRRDK